MMQMNSREGKIALVLAVLIGFYLLDLLVITPVWEWRTELHDRNTTVQSNLSAGTQLVSQLPRYRKAWDRMREDGLRQNRFDAETGVYNKLREWAQASGVNLQAITPERVDTDTPVAEITFRATATGTMRSMTGFFQRLENANFPLRIKKMTLGSRRDGMDDLSLELTLSTLYQPPTERDVPSDASARADFNENSS